MKRFFAATILALASSLAFAAAPDFKAMLKALDEMGDFGGSDFSAVYTIVTQKPNEKDSILKAEIYRRDEHGQFALLIREPSAQKGQGYLKVDDNMWFYNPESGKFVISSTKENIENSKAKNSDLRATSYAEDYDIESWTEEMMVKYPVYVLTLKAKNDEVSYQKLKLYIRKDKSVILREEDYSLNDRLMRTISFPPKYIQVGGKTMPSQMLIEDQLNKGEKSQITISEVSLAKLADSTFTKAFLEKVSK